MKVTGWTEDQVDAADSALCDWFLAFDELERQRADDVHHQVMKALGHDG